MLSASSFSTRHSTGHEALPTVHEALGLLNSTDGHWVWTAWVTGERTASHGHTEGMRAVGRIRTPEDLAVALGPTQ